MDGPPVPPPMAPGAQASAAHWVQPDKSTWAPAAAQLPHGWAAPQAPAAPPVADSWGTDTDGGLWGGAAPQQGPPAPSQQAWQQGHVPSYYGQGMYSGGRAGGAGPAPFAGGHGAGRGPGRGGPAPPRGPIGAAPGGGHGRGGYAPYPPGAGGYYGGGGGGGWQQQRATRDVRCYACGHPGHVARDCAAGPSGPTAGGWQRNGGGGGGGSGSPARGSRPGSSGPPQWRRADGGWLVPLPGSAAEAEHDTARARAAAAGAPGRVVTIMRGLPGSGKSTRAAEIAAAAERDAATGGADSTSSAPAAAIHSTDSYFVDKGSGQYIFDASRLSNHHDANFDAFAKSLAAGVAAVVVDNTNLQPWQFERYVAAAWRAGYRVREEVVGKFDADAAAEYAARCVHGVGLDKILMMAQQWQPGP